MTPFLKQLLLKVFGQVESELKPVAKDFLIARSNELVSRVFTQGPLRDLAERLVIENAGVLVDEAFALVTNAIDQA